MKTKIKELNEYEHKYLAGMHTFLNKLDEYLPFDSAVSILKKQKT